MAAVQLTRRGYELLHAELRNLIEVRRPQVMQDLAQAREYGDLRENAEYETAKRDQGMIEGRIHELEDLLASVEIVDIPKEVECVCMGSHVRIENLETRQDRACIMVTEQESHLIEGSLSISSPLGQALMGAKLGEEVVFEAPAGTRRFRILELHGANGDD